MTMITGNRWKHLEAGPFFSMASSRQRIGIQPLASSVKLHPDTARGRRLHPHLGMSQAVDCQQRRIIGLPALPTNQVASYIDGVRPLIL